MEAKMEWFETEHVSYGKFTFTDKISDQPDDNFITGWKEKFATKSGDKFSLVWDCTELLDYESACKTLWQETLRQTLHQINRIWIISNPEIIKVLPYLTHFFEDINFKMIFLEKNIYKISPNVCSTQSQ